MPTYDYRCQECGHEFELFQSMTAKVKRKCPECSQPKLKRLIGTGAGVIFKGSGFYETDYRSTEYQKRAQQEKDASSPKKSDSTASTSDAKPGAKKGSGGSSKSTRSSSTKNQAS